MTEPIIVDARGLRCPLPVIELARAARAAAPGAVLKVLATDPAARFDVPAWARLRGHELLSIEPPDNAGPVTTGPAADESATVAITVRTHP